MALRQEEGLGNGGCGKERGKDNASCGPSGLQQCAEAQIWGHTVVLEHHEAVVEPLHEAIGMFLGTDRILAHLPAVVRAWVVREAAGVIGARDFRRIKV